VASSPIPAVIGLGSNLQDPRRQVTTALAELGDLPQSRLVASSSLYRSAPMSLPGAGPQPDFVNAVALLETRLTAQALLEALQALEQAQGRERHERWGPRTLDLDLLLFGDQIIASDSLTIPHPGLYDRNFVLYPLAELAGSQGVEVPIPGGRDLASLLADCPQGDLEKLAN
jgi:2-amino-4-hydroxy-6-hydroxymethyldihydropteridine diphosphokinase